MIVRHHVLATAGHIDHGKSALVKALTGTDPDRLPEEKKRGITIDLGFAEMSLTAADGSTIHAGIVDVPGHEGFVRNMIAGVGSIDLALLVVAADDGWMPQTEEHFQILTYFNVKRIVVAVTKCDAFAAQTTATEVREQLRGSGYETAPIVSVSSLTGLGLEELRAAMTNELGNSGAKRDIGKPRLHVDRVFTMRGAGTVVTGTLVDGTLHEGQSVSVEPGGFSSRIRSLQSHGQPVKNAGPGNRVALNLTDVSVGSSGSSVQRGDVITLPGVDAASGVDVLLERSARIHGKAAVLKHGSMVYLHHGTSRISARVFLMKLGDLLAGDRALAYLSLEKPIVAFLGDRFVLRDQSNRSTIAGGVILDPESDRRRFRTTPRKEFLTNRAKNPDDIDTAILSELIRAKAISINRTSVKWAFSANEVQDALERLAGNGRLFLRGELAIEPGTWRAWLSEIAELIDKQHAIHPEADGFALVELRAKWGNRPGAAFDLLLEELCRSGFTRRGDLIGRSSHRPSLPSDLAGTAQEIMRLLSAKPLDPPGKRELFALPRAREALSYLIGNGDVVEISPDLVLLQKVFDQMLSTVRGFLEARGKATVSELRQYLGTSRRVVVPLLEKLDKQRITSRNGDHRTLTTLK